MCGEFIACLPGADDELKRRVETIDTAQTKTVQPQTNPAILLMLKLQCPAPYFANALLPAVFYSYGLKSIQGMFNKIYRR